ncbi:MAG: alpha/beta hydrolase, partial [Saprospiraceae bacterium]|nr:alpha/beta hydrolase [Saprospiraceae bacterium]
MKRRLLSLFIFSLSGLSFLAAQNPGCDGVRYLDDIFTAVKKTTVTYAPSINHFGQNINLSMDIYEPEGDPLSARPVVILAHGGSFVFGDKSMMQPWCELLAKKGYIAASIQYRLFPFFILGLPDSIEVFDTAVKAMGDMKAAVRYFREDAASANLFRADQAHIFIGGYSAGAVTALHTAYIDAGDQLPAFLQTLVSNNGGLEGVSGTASNKTYASNSSAVVNMSGGLYRSFWVEADEPPLVSVHGTADATVPYTFGLAANIAFLEGSSLVHEQADEVG